MVKGIQTKAKIPDDELQTRIAEMIEFDGLLTSMESCGNHLLNALSQLKTAPLPLLNDIANAYTADSDCAQLLTCLSTQLNACFTRMTNGIAHVEGLLELIQEVRPRIAAAKDAQAARQAAWVAKVSSDRANGAFKGFAIKAKSTLSSAIKTKAKSTMSKAKCEADELFNMTTQETKKSLDNLLLLRWPITGTVLAEFFHCYAGMFEAPPKLANELYNYSAKLAKTCEERLLGCAGKIDQACDLAGVSGMTQGKGGCLANGQICFVSDSEMDLIQIFTNKPSPLPSTTPKKLSKPAPASSTTPKKLTIAGCRALSFLSQNKIDGCQDSASTPSSPSSVKSRRPGITAITIPKFLVGEKVEMWCNSENTWIRGIVAEIFDVQGSWNNMLVPADVIKVQSAAGVKFIKRDHQINEVLRKPLESFEV